MSGVEVGTLYDMPGFDGLRFAVVARVHRGERIAAVVVFDDRLAQVGHLRWEAHDLSDEREPIDAAPLWSGGEILHVEVRGDMRRRGIASSLRRVATDAAAEMGWCAPRHSRTRTPDGDQWARSFNEDLPPLDPSEPTEYLGRRRLDE